MAQDNQLEINVPLEEALRRVEECLKSGQFLAARGLVSLIRYSLAGRDPDDVPQPIHFTLQEADGAHHE